MKCPGCGLYHPPQYKQCVSCGLSFDPQAELDETKSGVVTRERPKGGPRHTPHQSSQYENDEQGDQGSEDQEEDDENEQPTSGAPAGKLKRRSKAHAARFRASVPVILGVLMFTTVLLVSAGATIFFLTKPPDDERLYQEGLKQVASGEYAFAVKTLNDAASLRPKDARVFLALARAYVGVDQVDKAWDCVSQAQQLGAGVAAEPALASDLANYYRQRGQYEKAINLLRPLAKANVAGKKAELADLDAMWGDESLRAGKPEQALRCWEEVHDLNDGSRASEAESRLATIYQKLANNLASDSDPKNDDQALKYLNKLNNIAQNPKNYEMAADLYEKQGELELAIDQLRKAHQLAGKNQLVERKLADLLSRRGKELLDQGNTDAGYGYLQQAKELSPENSLPAVALRNLVVTANGGMPRISGDIWNPTDNSINSLTMKVEVFDTTNSKVVWTKDVRIIDEFVRALGGHESKSFDVVSGEPARANGTAEFRVYLDGNLYKSYPIGEKSADRTAGKNDEGDNSQQTVSAPPRQNRERSVAPPVAPQLVREQASPPVAQPINTPPVPGLAPTLSTPTPGKSSSSSEEKTMKDLDQ